MYISRINIDTSQVDILVKTIITIIILKCKVFCKNFYFSSVSLY
uniref:Uncharacterized protein n=1 Tax=Acrosorium ciliolatum TaxID=1550622 RepID=A0A1Z1M1Z8_9FLOR|nr:hypothetical protein [Acrosorium ciliolatum]ARW59922.1 hypothetical protein [Acrosorium ciliolatum]